jgi:Putative zinc-finger
MNCEHVDQLLPLYVGGDLEEERSSLVAAHVQSCTECARAADEYDGANRLLQRYEPPFVSDGVYAGIRRRVVDEIERKSQAPVWSSDILQIFAPSVQSRMRWITAALLLAMSVTALYLIANRSNELADEQQVADGPRTGEGNAADNRAGSGSENGPSLSSKGSDSLASTRSAFARKKVVNAGHRSGQPAKAIVHIAHRGTVARTPLVSPNKRLVHSDVDVSQPSSRPLRVEMQTSDPNIRIIWLSSQRPEGRAKETSKGI